MSKDGWPKGEAPTVHGRIYGGSIPPPSSNLSRGDGGAACQAIQTGIDSAHSAAQAVRLPALHRPPAKSSPISL